MGAANPEVLKKATAAAHDGCCAAYYNSITYDEASKNVAAAVLDAVHDLIYDEGYETGFAAGIVEPNYNNE